MPKFKASFEIVPLTNAQLRQAWIRPDEVDPHALLIEIKRQQLVFQELIHLHALVFNACHAAGLQIVAVDSIRSMLTTETDESAKLKLIEQQEAWTKAEASDRRRGNGLPGGPHRGQR